MWPFKRKTEFTESINLTKLATDVFVLRQRFHQLEIKILALDKRVIELEKILKTCNIHVTIN